MKIDLVAFMSHDKSTIELPARGVVLVGGPNGAGKSAIIEAIGTAMWGRGLRGRWSPWRANTPGSVTISDGLLVERRWTGKGKSLEWKDPTLELDGTFDTTSKAQEALEAVVGSFDVWRRTCVFSAADAAHFTMATDAERKELLETLLGLGWFDRALTECRKDLRAAQTTAGQADRDKALAEAKISGLADGITSSQEVLGELRAANTGFLRAEATRLSEHMRDVATEAEALRERRAALLDAGGQDKERAAQMQGRLSKLHGTGCPLCGQDVDDALRLRLRDEATTTLDRAAAGRTAAESELRRVSGELNDLQEEAEDLRGLLDKARTELQVIERERSTRERLAQSLKTQVEEAEIQRKRVEKATASLAKLHADIAELEACERVLGVRGARAHVVGRTLAGIESLANAWLTRLSSSITVQLLPYTEKKSGGVVDAISLNLVGAGGESGYLGASAGERRRVDVALLLALAELAASTNNGATWRSPIFFDECADSLDADGREAVVDLIQQLATERCVVMISHDSDVLSSMRADLRLRIDRGHVHVV